MPSESGLIQIIHTNKMREKFYVEILTNGVPVAEFQGTLDSSQSIELLYKQPGMMLRLPVYRAYIN